ncbi:unnamed protein product [Ranitomeya imitator]|uniref:Serine/threonine-protein kinase NLK n=1 Tax=Ranitomeya imitator TaxID=111125 RepID=A0ABN9LBJ4_9NEOB|nr:unnamed protein product [Ranitomeya imitator]
MDAQQEDFQNDNNSMGHASNRLVLNKIQSTDHYQEVSGALKSHQLSRMRSQTVSSSCNILGLLGETRRLANDQGSEATQHFSCTRPTCYISCVLLLFLQPSLPVLYTLSSQATHEAVHLLCRMLVFDPSKRISAKDALAHPYLDEGRLRYHTCMCKCCFSTSTGRVYTSDFEPITNPKFDDTFEKNLSSVRQVKEIIHQFILEQQKGNRVPLCINPQSAAFKSFIRSANGQSDRDRNGMLGVIQSSDPSLRLSVAQAPGTFNIHLTLFRCRSIFSVFGTDVQAEDAH